MNQILFPTPPRVVSRLMARRREACAADGHRVSQITYECACGQFCTLGKFVAVDRR